MAFSEEVVHIFLVFAFTIFIIGDLNHKSQVTNFNNIFLFTTTVFVKVEDPGKVFSWLLSPFSPVTNSRSILRCIIQYKSYFGVNEMQRCWLLMRPTPLPLSKKSSCGLISKEYPF